MRDTNAPQWATHMIELGFTDADYTDYSLQVLDYARLKDPQDEYETVVYVYANGIAHLVSLLAQCATFNHVEWCHPHAKDAQNSNYDSVAWSWME